MGIMGSDKVLESGKKIARVHQEHPEFNLIQDPDENFFLYSVRSTPRGQAYGVMQDDNGVYDCACPYFEFKGACKHIYAVMYLRGQIK